APDCVSRKAARCVIAPSWPRSTPSPHVFSATARPSPARAMKCGAVWMPSSCPRITGASAPSCPAANRRNLRLEEPAFRTRMPGGFTPHRRARTRRPSEEIHLVVDDQAEVLERLVVAAADVGVAEAQREALDGGHVVDDVEVAFPGGRLVPAAHRVDA